MLISFKQFLSEQNSFKILATVSNPNHPAVSHRKVTQQRKAVVGGESKELAFDRAKRHFQKQGLKVHDIVLREDDQIDEAIKGWKHAGRDLAKFRRQSSIDKMNVKLISLTKDGMESKMHDATKHFSDRESAIHHHNNVVKLNPNKKIKHNLYINGKHVDTLSEANIQFSEDGDNGVKSPKVGDHVKIMRARTLGGGSFHIKVEKIHKGKLTGKIQTGHSAGSTQTGTYIRHIDESREQKYLDRAIPDHGDAVFAARNSFSKHKTYWNNVARKRKKGISLAFKILDKKEGRIEEGYTPHASKTLSAIVSDGQLSNIFPQHHIMIRRLKEGQTKTVKIDGLNHSFTKHGSGFQVTRIYEMFSPKHLESGLIQGRLRKFTELTGRKPRETSTHIHVDIEHEKGKPHETNYMSGFTRAYKTHEPKVWKDHFVGKKTIQVSPTKKVTTYSFKKQALPKLDEQHEIELVYEQSDSVRKTFDSVHLFEQAIDVDNIQSVSNQSNDVIKQVQKLNLLAKGAIQSVGKQVFDMVKDVRGVVGFDTVADLYSGNENYDTYVRWSSGLISDRRASVDFQVILFLNDSFDSRELYYRIRNDQFGETFRGSYTSTLDSYNIEQMAKSLTNKIPDGASKAVILKFGVVSSV